MPPNPIVQNSILVGGLTLIGYMTGGKLGSMLGKFIVKFTYIKTKYSELI